MNLRNLKEHLFYRQPPVAASVNTPLNSKVQHLNKDVDIAFIEDIA